MLVVDLTGSGRGVAATVAFEVAPVLLGPVAGTVADRYPRRQVMVTADLARAVLVFVLVVSHTSTVTALAVAFGLSTASLLFGGRAQRRRGCRAGPVRWDVFNGGSTSPSAVQGSGVLVA